MNISDIAEMAGVSRAAVSRYLNDGYLSSEKKEAIRRVIEETGYAPSQQAQTLRTKKTNLIGVIIPNIDSEAVARMVSGITAILNDAGYDTLLANTENDPGKELSYLNIFKANRVDGIIFIATILTARHKALLREISVPMVLLGQRYASLPCIYHDDYHAAYDLALEFIKGGCRSFGAISVTKMDIAVGGGRLGGFLDACRDHGITVNPNLIKTGPFSMQSGYDHAKAILEAAPETDALFCLTDQIGIGALTYLHEQEISVPDQVSVCGFGHSRVSRVTSPPLATVHFHYRICGEEGAKLLLSLLRGKEILVKSIQLNYELQIYGSIKKISLN